MFKQGQEYQTIVKLRASKQSFESQSEPGNRMVGPEPCKDIHRLPQLFLAATVPC